MPASPTASQEIQLGAIGVSLEEFPLAASRMGFIAAMLFPFFDVAKQSSRFGRITLENLLREEDDERASSGNYNRGSFRHGQDSYNTLEHGYEETVDDREAAIHRDFFDALEVSGNRAQDVVLRNLEKRVVVKATDASIPTTPATAAWSDRTAAKPVDDVALALEKVYDTSGLRPNTLTLSWKRWLALQDNQQIIDRIKFSGIDNPKAVTLAALAELLKVEQILVAGATQNTANQAQPATLASVWPDNKVLVSLTDNSNDLKRPTLGRIFHWTGDGSEEEGRAEMYRDTKARSDVVRVRQETDEKLLLAESSCVITGT